jgi:cell division control protein 6
MILPGVTSLPSLFRDEDVLDPDYVPGKFLFRDLQAQDLASRIAPLIQGDRPGLLLLRGGLGTGKTTILKKVLGETRENMTGILPVYLNAALENTSLGILISIFDTLNGYLSAPSPITDKSLSRRIGELLQQKKVALLLALDTIDYLRSDRALTQVLGNFMRMRERSPGARVGVILVMSDPNRVRTMRPDPGLASLFPPQEIVFPPYTREEIRKILTQRAIQACKPGVVSHKILDRLVDATYPCGDIRVGIALLKMSVYSAMRARRVTVTLEDVEWVQYPIGERGSSHNKRIVSRVTEEAGGDLPLRMMHQDSYLNVWRTLFLFTVMLSIELALLTYNHLNF